MRHPPDGQVTTLPRSAVVLFFFRRPGCSACLTTVRLCVLSPLLMLFPFADVVESGLLGRVGDGFGNDVLQRSNPRRHRGFPEHHSLLVPTHGKRVLPLQSLAAAP